MKMAKFFSSKLFGLYVVIIVVLVASHFGFIEHAKNNKEIFKTTIDNFMERISTINGKTALFTSGTTSIEIGGGIIGATFAFIFSSLFGLSGTKVVEIVPLIRMFFTQPFQQLSVFLQKHFQTLRPLFT